MKLYHIIIALIIVTALSTVFGKHMLSDTKNKMTDAGFNLSHVNTSLFTNYGMETDIDDVVRQVDNSSKTASTKEQESVLIERFGQVWDSMSNGFTMSKNIAGQAEKDLGLPSIVFWTFTIILSLVFALKLGLGFILDR